jgi:hypothetical protein
MTRKQILKYKSMKEYKPPLGTIKSVVPDWYKDMEKYIGGKLKLNPEITVSVKNCMPFLDSLTTGYFIPCPADILIEPINEQDVQITWKSKDEILTMRNEKVSNGLPTPQGFSSNAFSWTTKMCLEAPSGYSLLITHPLNRFDLPFLTLSGIIDGNYAMGGGNLPVFFKNNYSGIIEQGTPIAQVIPIKLESWIAQEDNSLLQKSEKNNQASIQKILGWYKNTIWQKKSYD